MRKISIVAALVAGLFSSAALADWTGKDAANATITFVNPNTCTGTPCVPIAALATAAGATAYGTAGASNAAVLSVQGIASGTALPVSGTVAATQSGTWNVTNISGTVSLPTGAATSANQTSQITQETAINTVLGAQADAVCGTATGTCTLQALIKFLNTAATASTPAGTAIIGKVGIDQTTPGTTNAVAPTAGELHLGELGSNQIKVQVAQTVTASAYSAGNALGGLMTVANAARVSGSAGAAGTGGILTGMQLNSKAIQTGVQVDVFIFDANPTGSTCTDKTAFVIANADFDKVVGILTIPSTAANGAGWFGATTTGSVGIPTYYPVTYDLASSTSIYACAVVRAAITPAATTDISFKFNMLRN